MVRGGRLKLFIWKYQAGVREDVKYYFADFVRKGCTRINRAMQQGQSVVFALCNEMLENAPDAVCALKYIALHCDCLKAGPSFTVEQSPQ